jgi:hypothetical protein
MTTYKCNDCNGTGTRLEFANVYGGVCFTCNGKGRIKTDKNTTRPVIVEQHTRKTRLNYSLQFYFWSNDLVQVVKVTDEGSEGVRSVTKDQARELWRNPQSF